MTEDNISHYSCHWFAIRPCWGSSFFVVKGPAAEATDAPQPWVSLCNTVIKMISFIVYFPCNGAQVEWNWHGKTEVFGEKTCPSASLSTTNPTWTDPGSNTGLCGERPATNSPEPWHGLEGSYIPLPNASVKALSNLHPSTLVDLNTVTVIKKYEACSPVDLITNNLLLSFQ